MINLFDYWRSSASYRVRIALGLAGLEWQNLPIDLVKGAQRSPEYLSRNPQGLVPVLEIDEISLTQSLAIIEYLDETRSLEFLPKDPIGRARVRALAYALAMEIHPVCNLKVAKFVTENSGETLKIQDWMIEFITSGLTAFEAMLGNDHYCYGDQVTLADICLVPQIYNANRWNVDLSSMPKITRINAKLLELDAFAKAIPVAP
jgi:maleylacetoacetate isomerase